MSFGFMAECRSVSREVVRCWAAARASGGESADSVGLRHNVALSETGCYRVPTDVRLECLPDLEPLYYNNLGTTEYRT